MIYNDATRTVTMEDGSIRDYTAEENAAADARAAEFVAASNEAELLRRARLALTKNNEFLALAAPTNAQTLAQVKLLTKEATSLIKLQLRDLTDLSGT